MMTPDELRALADALSVPHRELATVDVIRAAAYLRACASAQAVAYRQWNSDEGYWYYGDASCAEKDDELLYTHTAPAAPQAEPKREPLTARRILEIEDDAIRQWRDNGMIDDRAVVFARMIERELGIGGSDAE